MAKRMTKQQVLDTYLNAARESGLCPTCGRPDYSPFRIYDKRGKVTSGCVDEFHSGRLVPISESSFWHHRKEAKAIRKAIIDRLCS